MLLSQVRSISVLCFRMLAYTRPDDCTAPASSKLGVGPGWGNYLDPQKYVERAVFVGLGPAFYRIWCPGGHHMS